MASKSEISFIKSLHQKKYREQHGLFIVEGTKMVNELLTSGFSLYAIYALETYLPSLQISAKLPENIKIAAVTESELHKMSAQRSPNKVLAVAYLPQDAVEDDSEQWRPGAMWMALDKLQDPGNMGTIIRIADWFGMAGVIASEDSVEFFNPKVVQASMGSIFRVKLQQRDLVQTFREADVPVYGALLNGESLYETGFRTPGILLLGNESQGITPQLKPYITHPVTIPAFGRAESLNVATAAAVICSEIRRKGS